MKFKGYSGKKLLSTFGYDTDADYDSTEHRKEVRDRAIAAIKKYDSMAGIDSEAVSHAINYSDQELEREQWRAEQRRREAERQQMITQTKLRNKETDAFADDDYAKALYEHLIYIDDAKHPDDLKVLESNLNKAENEHKEYVLKYERVNSVYDGTERMDKYLSELQGKIDDLQDEIDDANSIIDENNIYGLLYKEDHYYYGLTTFDVNGDEYAVGTDEEAHEAAKEYYNLMIDDNGYEAFSDSFVSSFIDEDKMKENYIESEIEHFKDMIEDNPEDWFDEDVVDIENISDEEIEDRAKSLAEDRYNDEVLYYIENNDYTGLQEHSLIDISDFIDKEDLIESVISIDGLGHALAPYNGEHNEYEINGTWYSVFRIN